MSGLICLFVCLSVCRFVGLSVCRHWPIECRLVDDRFVRHLLLPILMRKSSTVVFSAVNAVPRERSSAGRANVAVFVIDARRCEERVCPAA